MNADATKKQRQDIIRAAEKAFRKKGLREVTMDEIASIMGISKRTLYELFKNKEQLILEVLKYDFDESEKKSMRIASKSENALDVVYEYSKYRLKKMSNTNRAMFSDLHRYPRVLAEFDKYMKNNSSGSGKFFNRGISEGLFRQELDYVFMELMFQSQMRCLLFDSRFDNYNITEMFEMIIITFMRSICTQKGYDIIEKYMNGK